MTVLGFPVLRVPFGILGFLPLGLVLELCLPCIFLLYVSHLTFSRVLYFSASFSYYFWSLFFSHSFGHPLNLLFGEKTLFHLPYLLLVLVLYLMCCFASRAYAALVWPVCWRVWLALTMFVPCAVAVFLDYLSHRQIFFLIVIMLDHAFPC